MLRTLLIILFVYSPVVFCKGLVATTSQPLEHELMMSDQPQGTTSQKTHIYEMLVQTEVSNRFASTEVTSRIINRENFVQEATFSVVLPETAYISGFEMEIDRKTYKGKVTRKEKAKTIYDNAVKKGESAAHVGLDVRDSNYFNISLSIEPQGKATFRLYYEEFLQRINNQYQIVTNIFLKETVRKLSVDVNIRESQAIQFLHARLQHSGNEIAPSNLTQAEIKKVDENTRLVKFSPGEKRQTDLAAILGHNAKNGIQGQFIVEYDVARKSSGGEILYSTVDHFFVHFFGFNYDILPLPKYIVFILDTSGSMEGDKIKQLKEAMNTILSQLNDGDVFNIVQFNDDVKTSQTFQTTDPKSIQTAKETVEGIKAEDTTDIKLGLETGLNLIKDYQSHATRSEEQSLEPIIMFLTDGEPYGGNAETNTTKITRAITEMNKDIKATIFCLAFGDDANRSFLEKLSLENKGFTKYIYEANDAHLQLQEFYKTISSPLLTNVTFDYISSVNQLTKTKFWIYFNGSELVVAGKGLKSSNFLGKIESIGRNGKMILKPEIINVQRPLKRLWAYLTIRELFEQRETAINKTVFTKRALNLALKYHFVTPLTSITIKRPGKMAVSDVLNPLSASNKRAKVMDVDYDLSDLVEDYPDDNGSVQSVSASHIFTIISLVISCIWGIPL